MRKGLIVGLLCFAASCLSVQTKENLARLESNLTALQSRLTDAESALSSSSGLTDEQKSAIEATINDLRKSVETANSNLAAAKADAVRERVENGASTGKAVVDSLSPIIGSAIPGAAWILAMISNGLGGLAAAYRKPEESKEKVS